MSASRLDAVYRSLLITKFFTKGWGKPENLRRLFEFRKIVSNREECFKLIDRDYPVTITKEETAGDCKIVEGHFMSPLEKFLPGIVPEIAQKAHFQALVPLKWADPDFRPMCLHLAGTGDHYFWRRRNLMAKPLLKEAGIGGIILENPFYGLRKPLDQVRSSLHNVSDIFVMGGCLILESLVLFHWCERNNLGPLGVTGLSMGGHMASLAATNWPKPLVLVPCLSWSTASAVFLQGVMSQSINWDLLEDQYLSDGNYREKLSKMVTVIDEAFLAGKNFAQKVSQSMGDTLQSKLDNKNHMEAETITHSKMDDNSTDGIVKNIKTDDEISKNEIVNANSKNENLKTELVNESCLDEMAKTTKMDFVNTKNFVSVNKSVSATRKQSEDVARFIIELKGLLHEGLISESLYLKLTSDEKFELDAQDVEELNELNKDEILARAAGKFNLGQKINIKCYSTNSSYTESDKQHGRVVNKTAQHTQVTTTKAGVIRTTINHSNSQLETDTKIAKVIVTEKKTRNFGEMSTDILTSLPFIKRKVRTKKIDISKINWRDREALQFMRGVMDECTHLSNFSVPFDTSLIIAVCAKHDAYVPREDVGELEEIWPGAEVRYVDAGHVSAYLLHQSMFRSCIIEAFERSKKKWKDGKHIA